MTLQEIDGMRKGGKWVDAEGNKPEGQLVRNFSRPAALARIPIEKFPICRSCCTYSEDVMDYVTA